ncbi:MAG: polyprenyl synthetase family protein [Treponema sp.]|jgi:octaprenyl-diphosphate synthase|nr:polyprenyl synthetase family protein [Treponema sp.]
MNGEINQRLKDIESILDAWLPQTPNPEWAARVFPGPESRAAAELLESLILPCRDLLSRGGKRWRPLLMVLVCEALGGGDAALALTPLVEFCHNASLIHDDIEDASDQRRGKPAVHLIYGADAAINSGSFFYFLPLSCIDAWDAPAELKERIRAVWGEYLRRLHLGQAMDIHWHRDFQSLPGINEYYTMCGLKTGCMARLAAVLGAQIALSGPQPRFSPPAVQQAAEQMGRAAEQLGVGFQILDDVKNLDAGLPGKKRGDDVVEGKKSLPVLLYLHGNETAERTLAPAEAEQRRNLVSRCFNAARAGGTKAPEVEELIAALDKTGALEKARRRGLALIREGAAGLTPSQIGDVPLQAEGRRLLAEFVNLIT